MTTTLFKRYIDQALKEWNRKCSSMVFADDRVIITEDEDYSSHRFRQLQEEYIKWRLETNTSKIEYLVVDDIESDLEV